MTPGENLRPSTGTDKPQASTCCSLVFSPLFALAELLAHADTAMAAQAKHTTASALFPPPSGSGLAQVFVSLAFLARPWAQPCRSITSSGSCWLLLLGSAHWGTFRLSVASCNSFRAERNNLACRLNGGLCHAQKVHKPTSHSLTCVRRPVSRFDAAFDTALAIQLGTRTSTNKVLPGT